MKKCTDAEWKHCEEEKRTCVGCFYNDEKEERRECLMMNYGCMREET